MAYNSRDAEILQALQRGDVLTPAIAASRWGVLALHSAIARLRKQGHNIPCQMTNGHGSYRLITGESCATRDYPVRAMNGGAASCQNGQQPVARPHSAAQASTAASCGGDSHKSLRQGEPALAEPYRIAGRECRVKSVVQTEYARIVTVYE